MADMVRRGDLTAEFVVVSVERGPLNVDLFDERRVAAVAVVRPVHVFAGSTPANPVRLAFGDFTSNPSRPEQPEVLDTSGWTFAPGDRVLASLIQIRERGVELWEFSSPDAYFVLDGDSVSKAQRAGRRDLVQTPFLRAVEAMSADELRRAVEQAARTHD